MKTINRAPLNLLILVWLAIGIILAGLPHWQRLPVWLPIIHIVLLLARLYVPWRFSAFWDQQHKLIALIRLFVMGGGIAGIYLSYGSLTGRDVGVALLILLAGLKLFESHNSHDFYISTYLSYFLVITNFFYTQTISTALYMLVVIVITTSGLVYFHDTEQRLSFFERFKSGTVLILQSFPIMLILFVLFPRIEGPLWGLPEDAHIGVTGIDDQMTFGTISQLVQSNEIAFRVTFDGQIPEQSQLYWRGPVLWRTDGQNWTVGRANTDKSPSPVQFKQAAINYELTIEPTNKRWLFGLEMVESTPPGSYLTHDRQLKARKPIQSRKIYKLRSYNQYFFGKKAHDDFSRALQLPRNSHLKTKQFGQALRAQYQKTDEIITTTLDWFKNQNFVYTLKPPIVTGDFVDDFLFDSRQGFCEHYAAAFTVIMRAAGIPARVVTGYLGGEVNPIGRYLIVRQYHAHAWAEVWLADQGWVRVDPTAVISDRVSDGIEGALPEAIIDIPLNLQNNAFITNLWQRLRNTTDLINYQWAQWVLGYGQERQQSLLQSLGFGKFNWLKLTVVLFILLGVSVAIIAMYLFTKTPNKGDPAKMYYDLFCKKMSFVGLPKKTYEGPHEFAQRLTNARQDLTEDVQKITALYISIRYCSNNDRLSQLKNAIQSFKPSKMKLNKR